MGLKTGGAVLGCCLRQPPINNPITTIVPASFILTTENTENYARRAMDFQFNSASPSVTELSIVGVQ